MILSITCPSRLGHLSYNSLVCWSPGDFHYPQVFVDIKLDSCLAVGFGPFIFPTHASLYVGTTWHEVCFRNVQVDFKDIQIIHKNVMAVCRELTQR